MGALQPWSQLRGSTAESRLTKFLIFAATLTNICHLCQGSPPVDYFVYTSPLTTSSAEAQNVTSMLPTIDSIFNVSSPSQHQTEKFSPIDQQNFAQLSRRVMALVRNSSHRHDNDLVDLEATRFAWHLMEKQAKLYMRNRVNTLRPFVNELLTEARVSAGCQSAIEHWMDNLAELRHWAVLMWNSWGDFPPAGLFEGTYTNLGSYRGCMSIDELLGEVPTEDQTANKRRRNQKELDSSAQLIGKAQYCTLDFQPIVPTRPRFHSIFKQILSLSSDSGLIGGDFNDQFGDHLGTKHTAHGFPSTRYSKLFRDKREKEEQQQEPPFKKTISESDGEKINANEISARAEPLTISNASPNEKVTTTTTTAAALANSYNNSTLSLRAEALIELATKAQYFYYVKFRLGACLPSRCSKEDVERLAQSGKYQRRLAS